MQVIEQLTEKNLIKDFFEELAGGRPRGDLEGRAARLGCDLSKPHAVLVAEPADDALERALRLAAPGSLFDRREHSVRVLVNLSTTSFDSFLERLQRIHGELAEPASVGVSSVCEGEATFADGFAEAQQALLGTVVLRGGPAVLSYEDLGAYKYLLRVAVDGGIRDATVDAVSRLAEYDAQRGSQLVLTLEEFLRRHGNISQTSETLFVHPNTLRQRLRRIAELSGLDLRKDDWLMIEIAVKMVKLEQALGCARRRNRTHSRAEGVEKPHLHRDERGCYAYPSTSSQERSYGWRGRIRGRRLAGHAGARRRVRVRAVRRHVRAAEREARPGRLRGRPSTAC